MKYGASLTNTISRWDVIAQTAVKTLQRDDEQTLTAVILYCVRMTF